MNLNNLLKNKFNPLMHWYLILTVFFVMVFLTAIYGVYNFIYIKKQISIINTEVRDSIKYSTSPETIEKNKNNTQFLNDVNNLNVVLDRFKAKELEYNKFVSIPAIVEKVATSTE